MKTLAYIFMSLSALAMVGCRGKGDALKEGKMEYAPEVNTVEVMTLTRKDFPRQLLSNGKLSAGSRAELKFGTTGAIKTLNIKNGQHVSAGQIIAELDRPDLILALESARLAMDKSRLDFYDVLAGQGYTAKDTTSVPADMLDMAKVRSGYGSTVNALERAKYDLSCTILKSPFNGTVADLKVKRYDQAPADALCTLLDDSRMDVDFTVMESEYPFISNGLKVNVIPFADASKTYVGHITGINPVVDKNGQISEGKHPWQSLAYRRDECESHCGKDNPCPAGGPEECRSCKG